MRLSVILPVLNEARRIGSRLRELRAQDALHEIILVDGGSTDGTLGEARESMRGFDGGAPVKIVHAPRGRASQMNAGARTSEGDVLLFQHADTVLPAEVVSHVRKTLSASQVVAGAFRTWTVNDTDRPFPKALLHLADLRSRYSGLPYGDQALFVRREVFFHVGGFPEQPLMEDLELARRLRCEGRVTTIAAYVQVSGRRFVARPVFYFTLMNVFPLLYRAGVSADRLGRLYGAIR